MNPKSKSKGKPRGRPQKDGRSRDDQSGVFIAQSLLDWKPKTELGKKVYANEITNPDQIFLNGYKILEEQIVDKLMPDLQTELLLVGQSKGKFGGGQRRAFRQTQKATKDGSTPAFTTYAIAGNKNGFVGLGVGTSKETVPAREKATRKAKLNMIKVLRGSGSWQTAQAAQNSIPFKVSGKCGSVTVTLMPAPKGTGLVCEKECAKILAYAGVQDVWSRIEGKTKTKINVVKACFEALKNLSNVKATPMQKKMLGIDLEVPATIESIQKEQSQE